MTTLAARVLEAIEAAEQLVKVPNQFGWPQEGSWHTLRCGANWGNQNCDCECPVPAAVLRRCKSDRRVWWRHNEFYCPMGDMRQCEGCNEAWPCPEFTDLAYALGVPLEQEET